MRTLNRARLMCATLVCVLALAAFDEVALSGQTNPRIQEVLHNADVMALVRAGLSEEVVILKIRGTSCEFDLSADALAVLKAGGVPDGVLAEMLKASDVRLSTPNVTDAPSSSAASPPSPPVAGKQFALFHFVTGAVYHYGRLTISQGRVTWTETNVSSEGVDLHGPSLFGSEVRMGTSQDDFDVPCSDVLDIGKNKAVLGYHVHLAQRKYNLARSEINKAGKLTPKNSGQIPGLLWA